MPLTIRCFNYMSVYQATDPDDLLRLALTDNSCVVKQTFGDTLPIVDCDPYQFSSSSTADKCSSPHTQGDDVAEACRELQGNSHQVYSQSPLTFFSNVFCGICSLDTLPYYGVCDKVPPIGPQAPTYLPSPPLSLLLNFGRSQTSDGAETLVNRFHYRNCTNGRWASPSGDCLKLHCTPGKSLDHGTCTTVMPQVSGLGYRLKIWLVPGLDNLTEIIHNVSLSNLSHLFLAKLQEMISDISSYWEMRVGTVFLTRPRDKNILSLDTYVAKMARLDPDVAISPIVLWLDGHLVANERTCRDELETIITRLLFNDSIQLDVGGLASLTLTTVNMVNMVNTSERVTCSNGTSQHFINCSEGTFTSGSIPLSLYMLRFLDSFLNISNLLWCSYVSFNKTSYTIEVDETRAPPKINIELDLVVTRITFSEFSELNMLALDGDGVLNVCRQLLDTKLGQMDEFDRLKNVGRNYFWSADYILTLVVMSVSMTCLLATLLTYSLFPVLRSRAGKRNMFLSGSLLLAHASLLATSHISGPSWLCTAVGVSTHFLWLWMFTWTFICSFQMFRVFTAKTRSSYASTRDQNCQFLSEIVLSFVPPVLATVSVVVTSYVTTGGRTTGYGDVVCYLNSSLLVGVSVVAPLMLIVVCNLTFFTITVVKIHRVALLQSNDRHEDRKNLFVYAKLSSMTGAFWVLGVVDGAVDVSALRYISTVLNGLQGVFIFISYVCNKRVLSFMSGKEQISTSLSYKTGVSSDRFVLQDRSLK